MRKNQKRMALEFTQTLCQAHAQIKFLLDKKNSKNIMELLEQCQEGAIKLGTFLEKVESEEIATIEYIEQYCELVYQIYINVEQNINQKIGKQYKKLQNQLIKIKNSINNDIPQKTEIVFLPYMASMWDSFESVWNAAAIDITCDVYVVPIPYYERGQDGSFIEEHVEDYNFPNNVPITNYKTYDFSVHRPDIIFIHNPYDDCNSVTSVHPFFYSENLKKYTEKLVYIPYFTLDDISPDNQKAIDSMKHFCNLPGVINADKVVVQSSNMRQIYINVLTRLAGEDTRLYWEEKILGLGSPKVDKIITTRIEDLEIPTEWNKIIFKQDGSRRKVVFYNTSIGTLLQYDEKMLIKMEEVFRSFYSNREDLVLLWRPHPLISATIKSMRPQIWIEYKRIVDQYRSEGWGIYDDTADMTRAIILSDGYYGDPSSAVNLYTKTNKPIMIQRFDKQELMFSDCSIIENEIFFYPTNGNSLMKLDLDSKKVCYISALNDYKRNIGSIDTIISSDNILFMSEISGNFIVQYNIAMDSSVFYDISCGMANFHNLACIGYFDNNIYVFPRFEKAIIEINLLKNSTTKYTNLYNDITSTKQESVYFSWGMQKGSDMWIIAEAGDLLVKYMLNLNEYEIYQLPSLREKCINFCIYNNIIYILSYSGTIYSWQIDDPDIRLVIDLKAKLDEYGRIVVTQNNIFILPKFGENILIYNIINKSINVYNSYPHDFKYIVPANWAKYSNYCENELFYYFAVQSSNYMLSIDKIHERIEWISIILPTDSDKMAFFCSSGNNVLDEAQISLESYISKLNLYESDTQEMDKKSVGLSILKKINQDER